MVGPNDVLCFYAVAHGRQTGVFTTWEESQEQVKGFKKAIHKKFDNREEAEQFVKDKKQKGTAAPAIPQESDIGAVVANIRKSLDRVQKVQDKERKLQDRELAKLETASSHIVVKPQAASGSKRKEEDQTATSIKRKRTDAHSTKNQFTKDQNGVVNVYVDGACNSNGYRSAQAGIGAYFGDNHPHNISEPAKGSKATNMVAEIQAATAAMNQILEFGRDVDQVCIHTDSEYVFKSMTIWISGWKGNGWKTAKKEDVQNQTDLKALDAAINAFKGLVIWNKVSAHKGIPGNEAADKLAKEGAKRFVTKAEGAVGFKG